MGRCLKILLNAGVKWVRHACQGFEWVCDGFWVGFGRVWVNKSEAFRPLPGAGQTSPNSPTMAGRVWVGFGGFCVGFAWV